MRDLRSILTGALRQEFLDRFDELTRDLGPRPRAAGGLQGLDVIEPRRLAVDDVVRAFEEIHESPDGTTQLPGGLEAIIMRFGRPAFFVSGDHLSLEDRPSSSEVVGAKMKETKARLDAVIPSVGRIDLRNHQMSWAGTGCIVAPDVVVTNRHVARLFADPDGSGFAFVQDHGGRTARADLDMFHEHKNDKESRFRLPKVRWIEPSKEGHHDVAFLSIRPRGEDDQPQPPRIELMNEAEFETVGPGRWLAVIGYPAFSIYNNAQDQQRIFQGVFDVKRVQPGMVKSVAIGDGTLDHDASTLGGNSGSIIVDLETGKAMALHFGGYEGKTNFAVTAPVIRRLMQEKLGID